MEPELVFTRVFEAPRGLVFKAWSHNTWRGGGGPHGLTNPVCGSDVRPGDALRIHMRGPDGTGYPTAGVYQEIIEPERLVFTRAALDGKGNPRFDVLNSVTFASNQYGEQSLCSSRSSSLS